MATQPRLNLWPFFLKHPLRSSKVPEAMCGSKLEHPKAVCRRCFQDLLGRIIAVQTADVQSGLRTAVETEDEIKISLWNGPANLPDGKTVWMQGRVENISRHLKNCPLAPEDDKLLGLQNCIRLGIVKTDKPTKHAGVRRTYEQYAEDSDIGLSVPSSSYISAGSSQLPTPNLPVSSATISASPSPLTPDLNTLSFFPFGSAQNTPSNSSSPVLPSSPIITGPPLSKRIRTASGLSRVASFSQGPEQWTQNEKDEFCRWLARMTASCGFPFIWVENPVWRKFCAKYLPQAPTISRNTLANRWIPDEVQRYRQQAIEQSKGSLVTIQCDGWTGVNFRHYIGFMVGTDKRQVHPVHVYDASNEPKTAVNLYTVIQDVRQDLEKNWGVQVIAICSDSSGESLKARKLALKDSPELMVPSCYAHQVALVVGDYFRMAKTGSMISFADKANELISYLRGRTQLLAKIRQIQEIDQEHSTGSVRKKILLPIRPVITRWTAHFSAYERLLELRWVLETLERKEKDEPLIVTGTSKAKEKGREMINIIKDGTFWYQILKMKKHLEPLARASCILQAAHTRLDQVAIIFGTLYKEYTVLREESNDIEDKELIQAALDSLDKRWRNTDQDICIAAVFCNPYYRKLPFSKSYHFSIAGLWTLFKRLWNRFYQSDPPPKLFIELQEYIEGKGQYEHLPSFLLVYQENANARNTSIDPLQVFPQLGDATFCLPTIAHRLLSVVANSASCERLFSMFGITLSRLRSRLRATAMTNLATLRMYLREEHIRYGLVKERLQRNLTSHSKVQAEQQTTEMDDQVEHAQREPESEAGSSVTHFSELAEVLIHAVEAIEDQDNSDGDVFGGSISLSLPEVFDLDNSYWMDTWKGLAMRNLVDEMEFHELMDLDGNAEVDDGNEADITLALT